MVGPGKLNSTFFSILRWFARIIVSLAAGLLLLFGVANLIGGEIWDIPPLGLLLFTLFVVTAVIAWIWEGVAGGILLLGSIIFIIYAPNAFWRSADAFPPTPLLLFPIAAIIFIVCWLKSRSKPEIS
jgi:hypothetical protein